MSITLTESQQKAFYIISNFFKTDNVILLTGSAGTGKTTLTRYISDHFSEKELELCAIAPTHKAKHVIETILNKGKFKTIKAFTIASILGKMKEHSYIGTKHYSDPNAKKFNAFTLFILDEVSMVSDQDLKYIISYINKSNKKLLIIGDSNQIPSPSSKYSDEGEYIRKANSFIFDSDIANVNLTEIVRQKADSQIIQLASFVRDNLEEEITFSHESGCKHFDYPDKLNHENIYETFKNFKDLKSSKIICYTNQAVREHNTEVRRILGFSDEKFNKGEILLGYANIGFPELIIENGRDYEIEDVKYVNNKTILEYSGLFGHIVKLRSDRKVISVFFIDPNKNYEILSELVERADKVNSKNSSSKDYAKYCELKNQILFIEDLYNYQDNIYSETEFKELYPLLFTKIYDIFDSDQKKILNNKLTEKINTDFPDLIENRLNDNKIIGDSEMFSDKFKIIDKDMYYGYALTAHKSQGSTYKNVIVDENDFKKIQNKFNYKLNKMEIRTREKNQLRYVSYTRTSDRLYFFEG